MTERLFRASVIAVAAVLGVAACDTGAPTEPAATETTLGANAQPQTYVVTTRSGEVRLVQASDGRVLSALKPAAGAYSLGAVTYRDGSPKVWVAVKARGCDRVLQPLEISSGKLRLAGNAIAGDFPAIAPDDQRLAFARPSRGLGCNGDETIVVRDLRTKRERFWSPDSAGNVFIEGLSWSRDGRHLAVLAVASVDGAGLRREIRTLDVSGGKSVADAKAYPRKLPAPDADYNAVAWLGDKLVANVVCCRSGLAGEVAIMDVSDGATVLAPVCTCDARQISVEQSDASGAVSTSTVGQSPCPTVSIDAASNGTGVLLLDRDGNVSQWSVGNRSAVRSDRGLGATGIAW